MRSSTGLKLFGEALSFTDNYYTVKIMDAWNNSEDIELTETSENGEKISDMTVGENLTGESTWDAENDLEEFFLPTFRENEVNFYPGIAEHTKFKDVNDWIKNGRDTKSSFYGNRINCAALVATLMKDTTSKLSCKAKIEIIANGNIWENRTLFFVVVNRKGPLNAVLEWGEDAFIVDIWLHNQYPKAAQLGGAFWASDLKQSSYFLNLLNINTLSLLSTVMDNLEDTASTASTDSTQGKDTAEKEDKVNIESPEVTV